MSDSKLIVPSEVGMCPGLYNEYIACNKLVELHGIDNFKCECNKLFIKFNDTWHSNTLVIHKQFLRLYHVRLGSWLCCTQKWKKVLYMLQLIPIVN